MIERKKTRKIFVGNIPVGGGTPVSVQSMTNTKTRDVNETIAQIRELEKAGCEIVRCAVPYNEDARALKKIVENSKIPVVADIHFQSKFVFDAIDAGCAGVRVNPGNILKLDDKVSEITVAAKQNKTALRIGVNAGSLDKKSVAKIDDLKKTIANKEQFREIVSDALVDAALREAYLFEKEDFYDFKISVKHHDPLIVIQAYRKLSEKGDWPLHIGVTEAGFGTQAVVKAASALSILLAQGIGDTIRVSLTDNPVQEIKVAKEILYSLELKKRNLEIISCPTCGRTEINLEEIVKSVKNKFDELGIEQLIEKKNCNINKDSLQLKVAIMGCIVNGPGEAKDADFGIACSKAGGEIFAKGRPVKRITKDEIVSELVGLAQQTIDEY